MTDPAAAAYHQAVSEIIDARASSRPYPPGAPDLRIVNHHQPRTVADLLPEELAQLEPLLSRDGLTLAAALADEEEFGIEAATVVDSAGEAVYRLYGWNFGVGYLFPAEGLEVVAFGAQHDLEHWSVDQRDLFAAMDRAMRAGGHGWQQPLSFCWSDDSCWEQLAGAAPHSRGSEPYLRRMLGLPVE